MYMQSILLGEASTKQG